LYVKNNLALLLNFLGADVTEVFILGISTCNFLVRGWLVSDPKVIRRVDKYRIEHVSTVVKISIPRISPDKNGVCRLDGYDTVSVAIHGNAAEKIEKDMADGRSRWRRRDLVEITGFLVAVPERLTRGRDALGRELTQAYRLQTNNSQNITNYSAYERGRTKKDKNAEESSTPDCSTIAPGRVDPDDSRPPLGKALEVDYRDF